MGDVRGRSSFDSRRPRARVRSPGDLAQIVELILDLASAWKWTQFGWMFTADPAQR
jgi:hypothetical protein